MKEASLRISGRIRKVPNAIFMENSGKTVCIFPSPWVVHDVWIVHYNSFSMQPQRYTNLKARYAKTFWLVIILSSRYKGINMKVSNILSRENDVYFYQSFVPFERIE